MEIEIVTTKRKLTKSIVNQFQELQIGELDNVNVLGFATNVAPTKQRILLLEVERFEYRFAYMDWRLGESKLSRRYKGTWYQEKTFNNEQDCNKYYNSIQQFKQQATQIFI